VAHLDVNEYVVLNNNIPRQPTELKSYNHSIQQNTPIRSLMSTDNVTVLQVMSQIAKEFRPQWSDKGCIAMSGFLFGPRETGDIDMKSTETPTTNIASIEMRKLNTYRYLYHSKEIINNSASGTQHRQGIIINVSQQSQGQPSKVRCLQDSVTLDSFAYSPLRTHRYLGPWEQYNLRLNDITRHHDRIWYDKQARLSSGEGPNHDIQSWKDRFVRTVGLSRATHLLFGVGSIDTSTTTPVATTVTKCALIFFGIPRAFTTTMAG
jgi:hypothetical protein